MLTFKRKPSRLSMAINGIWENTLSRNQYIIYTDPLNTLKGKISVTQKGSNMLITLDAHLMLINDKLHLQVEGVPYEIEIKKFWKKILYIKMPKGNILRLFKKKNSNYSQQFPDYSIF